MAKLKSNFLFFTTSPRTPVKMIPEIALLHEKFAGKKWNKDTQTSFMDELASSPFFEGAGSINNKDFSARDRINRAPKSLGFVDLSPTIQLTESGNLFVSGKRPQETFLRQLLKFQLPSPYHVETEKTAGRFCIRPYLEIMRLVRILTYLTFDELKIFAVQLTNYKNFEKIKSEILNFRKGKVKHKGEYKRFVDSIWTEAITNVYNSDIECGKTKTRETTDGSLKKFISTKKGNLRDYADACFRYLRYTGLVSVEHKSRKISFYTDRLKEVDYILSTVDRSPVFINDEKKYKEHLFSSESPKLYTDIKDNIVDSVMRVGGFTKRELALKSLDELKDLRDTVIKEKKDAVIRSQIKDIKSYALYSEIIDTYNEIISDNLYDAPLMLEYNTWRAMTMLNGGEIKGNLKFDDMGQPLSTAQGNMPDIECNYGDFMLSVEVTMQSGKRQYETEGEPVARHYGQMKEKTGKASYCLFIAPVINPAALMHFYGLNQINSHYYGGKTQIIPLELELFMKMIESSYNHKNHPTPKDIKSFLDAAIGKIPDSKDENDWHDKIKQCVNSWLVA